MAFRDIFSEFCNQAGIENSSIDAGQSVTLEFDGVHTVSVYLYDNDDSVCISTGLCPVSECSREKLLDLLSGNLPVMETRAEELHVKYALSADRNDIVAWVRRDKLQSTEEFQSLIEAFLGQVCAGVSDKAQEETPEVSSETAFNMDSMLSV